MTRYSPSRVPIGTLKFEAEPGTITCASFPGAVSSGPALTVLQTISLASLVISKMLASS